MTSSVHLELRAPDGGVIGEVQIACRPQAAEWRGTSLITTDSDHPVEATVQLLEEAEYTYRFTGDLEGPLLVEPRELFDPSAASGFEGRLRPKRATGTVSLAVTTADGGVGRAQFEVRSRKLGYRSEYRTMLNRIAEEAAEVLQSHFAPASLHAFAPDSRGDAETLYQRFAFVQSFVTSLAFDAAVQTILHRPHQEFRLTHEETTGGVGLRADRHLTQQLVSPGPRQRLPAGRTIGGLNTLPLRLVRVEHLETYDTAPNRFVKFALEHWRNLAESVEASLAAASDQASAGRGQREARQLAEHLSDTLRHSLFSDVDDLQDFPSASTVLQGRAGYRDIYRAFLQAEAAALVSWSGGADVFSAGQRDVAALYEYWCFLELVRLVKQLPGFDISTRTLFQLSKNQMQLTLRRGGPSVVKGVGRRLGKRVGIELWFNRSFSRGKGTYSSWSETMRPDCSLRIQVGDASPLSDAWLHFDAKYRVDQYNEIFVDEQALDNESTKPLHSPVSEDLLKMHAYRDAIRRSAGAYILYPGGDESSTRRDMFHEVLPGLGAFVLRPDHDGLATQAGADTLQRFIEDVMDHLASDGTDFGRADYWTSRTYREKLGRRLPVAAVPRPPADTAVLLGFVRGTDHRNWIHERGLYNLRADDRPGSVQLSSPELSAHLVVLYDAADNDLDIFRSTGRLHVHTAADLVRLGYPGPDGELYCCLELGERLQFDSGALPKPEAVRLLARHGVPPEKWGTPVLKNWIDLLGARVI